PLRKNGGFTAQELYFDNKLRFDLGNVVKVGDYLYGTPGASVMCVEFKTGAIKWQERSKSLSFLYANGRLYTHAEDGYVALVEPSPEAYREKARFIPPNRPVKTEIFTALSYLTLADGQLYIR
ncbi:MAG TPA: hypothetical protein VFQ43_10930, partial [Nitrososphaera sp.]|nr:hypothetical protein [Nitrososphaera sp.]